VAVVVVAAEDFPGADDLLTLRTSAMNVEREVTMLTTAPRTADEAEVVEVEGRTPDHDPGPTIANAATAAVDPGLPSATEAALEEMVATKLVAMTKLAWYSAI